MVNERILSVIGIVIAIIASWEKIQNFVISFFQSPEAIWNAFPSMILLGLIVWMFWYLGSEDN